MFLLPADARVFIASEPTDLRRSFDGLSAMVREVLRADPLSGHLFVFRGKSARRVKVLYWDRTGYALWHKRLESGAFRFPPSDAVSFEVTAQQLRMLLDGIQLGGRRQRGAAAGE